jgi:hypothetical protein
MGFEFFIYILRWVTKLIGKICDLLYDQSLIWLFVHDTNFVIIKKKIYIQSLGLWLEYFDVKLLTSGQM